jgi:hypothetical protein
MKLSAVPADALLIFNSTTKKFVVQDLDATLARLGYVKGEGGAHVNHLNTLLEEIGNITYIGEADPGTSTDQALWRVKRVLEHADGSLSVLWASGTASFVHVWDDRATFVYS